MFFYLIHVCIYLRNLPILVHACVYSETFPFFQCVRVCLNVYTVLLSNVSINSSSCFYSTYTKVVLSFLRFKCGHTWVQITCPLVSCWWDEPSTNFVGWSPCFKSQLSSVTLVKAFKLSELYFPRLWNQNSSSYLLPHRTVVMIKWEACKL